jgi:hypothetical protein
MFPLHFVLTEEIP